VGLHVAERPQVEGLPHRVAVFLAEQGTDIPRKAERRLIEAGRRAAELRGALECTDY
jgi:hypothetical protein